MEPSDHKREVSFFETVEHLGGWRVIMYAVLVLFGAYVFLVEFLVPRRRAQAHSKQRNTHFSKRKVM